MTLGRLAVCRTGHLVARGADDPSFGLKFCPRCGTEVLRECPACGAPVVETTPLWTFSSTIIPDFCVGCGKPFPWTREEAMIGKILEAVDNDPKLDGAHKLKLKEQIRNSREKSLTDSKALSLWKKMKNAVSQKTWDVAVPVLQAILTAEVKRQLGLPP